MDLDKLSWYFLLSALSEGEIFETVQIARQWKESEVSHQDRWGSGQAIASIVPRLKIKSRILLFQDSQVNADNWTDCSGHIIVIKTCKVTSKLWDCPVIDNSMRILICYTSTSKYQSTQCKIAHLLRIKESDSVTNGCEYINAVYCILSQDYPCLWWCKENNRYTTELKRIDLGCIAVESRLDRAIFGVGNCLARAAVAAPAFPCLHSSAPLCLLTFTHSLNLSKPSNWRLLYPKQAYDLTSWQLLVWKKVETSTFLLGVCCLERSSISCYHLK